MKNESVLCQEEGQIGIITLTLNRPERLNAINTDLLDRLIQQLARAGHNTNIASVILTGAGKS